MKKISDRIKKGKTTLRERGLTNDSYFHIIFDDLSEVKEHDTNWSNLAEESVVKYLGGTKVVLLSKHPVKTINIIHGNLHTSLDIQKGDKVYQAIRSTLMIDENGRTVSKIVGRVVGVVRDGVVIEERYLSSELGEISGIQIKS
jgi:hypothetical protein